MNTPEIVAGLDEIARLFEIKSGDAGRATGLRQSYQDWARAARAAIALLTTAPGAAGPTTRLNDDGQRIVDGLNDVIAYLKDDNDAAQRISVQPPAPPADAPAALAERVRTLEGALQPFADTVFNDNHDMTVTTSNLTAQHYIDAYFALRARPLPAPPADAPAALAEADWPTALATAVCNRIRSQVTPNAFTNLHGIIQEEAIRVGPLPAAPEPAAPRVTEDAVLAEREACAGIANLAEERAVDAWWTGHPTAVVAAEIAAAIRSRPAPDPAEPGWRVPAGWKLVPEEPTEDMLDAAVIGSRADVGYADVEELWPAMLEAAPSPPAAPAPDRPSEPNEAEP